MILKLPAAQSDDAVIIKARACADAIKDFRESRLHGGTQSFLWFLSQRLESEIDTLVLSMLEKAQ